MILVYERGQQQVAGFMRPGIPGTFMEVALPARIGRLTLQQDNRMRRITPHSSDPLDVLEDGLPMPAFNAEDN